MSSPNHFPRRRTSVAELVRRARLLEVYDRSGLSGAAFARQHGITYTTFCNWRQQRAKAKAPASPAFVQVELPTPGVELTVELGAHACVRLNAIGQIALATELIRALNAKSAC
jgi:transposase-like protein